jgi:thermostable 8-oxoguanine DNA glycosylase
MKTSRCFILHTRKNARVAGLDTHMLKFLRSKGHFDAPKSTPSNEKNYDRFEKLVLKYADEAGKTPAEFDLDVWNSYAK